MLFLPPPCMIYMYMYMQDIIKRTSEDHPDYKNLKQAQDIMVHVLYVILCMYMYTSLASASCLLGMDLTIPPVCIVHCILYM